MKALIVSDVHSNIYALNAIWSREWDSDVIVCAGDLVDYGPYPREVIAWMREHKVLCVQGNHDREVIDCFGRSKEWEHLPPEQRMWKHHNALVLRTEDIEYLESLPLSARFVLDGHSYGLTHIYNGYNIITHTHAFRSFCKKLFGKVSGNSITRLILGHTHRRSIHYLSDELLWLNSGSASYRRRDDPDQSAHYITIKNGEMSLRHVNYDIRPIHDHIRTVILKESEISGMLWAFERRDLS